jgi:hypothetical protein
MPIRKNKPGAGRSHAKRVGTISFSDPEFRARFEKARRKWQRKLRPLAEAARSSEQLTERDFAIRINARG